MWEEIGRFRDTLTAFMSGRDLAFTGGVMVRSYGARRTPTQDYDVLAGPSDYKGLWKFLEDQGFAYVGSAESADNFHHEAMNFRFDILVADNPLYREALATALTTTREGKTLKMVAPAHLAAMKVKAYAERRDAEKKKLDRRDVIGLLGTRANAEDVRRILAKHRPDLLPSLEEILAVGE